MSNPYNNDFQSGGYFFNPIKRDIAKRGNFREVFKLPS